LIFNEKMEEDAMLKLRNLYLYIVSFVSLMMILMGVIFTAQNITDVVFPTNYYEMQPIEKTGNLSIEEQKIYAENQKRYEENRNVESKKKCCKINCCSSSCITNICLSLEKSREREK